MRTSTEVANRLCQFINMQSRARKMTSEGYAEKYLGMDRFSFHRIMDGERIPSLTTLDIAIKRGANPRWLFLGETKGLGDPVKCFSHGNKNMCRALTVGECTGYHNCPFYQSEMQYLANNPEVSLRSLRSA